jgi:hypothetical protein
MVDIRPYRRLAVPFEPPHFADLVDVSDFISPMYEHFGVARFGSDMFSYTSVAILRRMCNSLGLRLLVNCRDPSSAIQAAIDGADFVTTGTDSIHSVSTACSPLCKVLVVVSDEMDLEFVKVSSAHGVFCDSSFVGRARTILPGGSVVFSSGGDVVSAVKDGADYATVDETVFRAKNPADALRGLAEEYREFT